MKDRLLKINARLQELSGELEKASDASAVEKINAEVKSLTAERAKIVEDMKAESRQAFTVGTTTPVPNTGADDVIEQRARDLKQGRSITLATLDILSIEHQGSELKPTFNEVSNIVDAVGIKNLNGGESFKQPYMKSYGEAGYTAEGADYNTAEPTFGYATVSKAKLTVYTEVSEEFEKLAPKYYMAEIQKNLTIAIKKKLAKEIMNGTGAADTLTGIFSANATAIEAAKDTEISAIDENTLDKLVYAYGGNEDFAQGVLILNKKDLLEFAKIRGTQDKKKVYTIDRKNRTIDDVPYIICSAVKALADAAAGDYVMAYGPISNYDLTLFSPIEVAKSTDYKFKQGVIAYKASGFFGGNVTSFNGFLRVKKAAAA
jgi:HK97 family phage major capsid protein